MGLEDTGSLKQQSLRTQLDEKLLSKNQNDKTDKRLETLEFVVQRWDWLEKEEKSETEKAEWSFWFQKDDLWEKLGKCQGQNFRDLLLIVLLLCSVNLFAVGRKCATVSLLWWLVVAARVASLGLLRDFLSTGNRRQSMSKYDPMIPIIHDSALWLKHRFLKLALIRW